MNQHPHHIEMIRKVAIRLGALRQKVVFLGGSATGFHITDKAGPQIRATKDVDIIVEVGSRVEYHQLEKTQRELGFFQKMIADDPICRWYIDDVMVDIMPTDEDILGFSNRWYLPAIIQSIKLKWWFMAFDLSFAFDGRRSIRVRFIIDQFPRAFRSCIGRTPLVMPSNALFKVLR